MGNDHRPANGEAEIVLLVLGDVRKKGVTRIQFLIAQLLIQGTVQLVGT